MNARVYKPAFVVKAAPPACLVHECSHLLTCIAHFEVGQTDTSAVCNIRFNCRESYCAGMLLLKVVVLLLLNIGSSACVFPKCCLVLENFSATQCLHKWYRTSGCEQVYQLMFCKTCVTVGISQQVLHFLSDSPILKWPNQQVLLFLIFLAELYIASLEGDSTCCLGVDPVGACPDLPFAIAAAMLQVCIW